MVRFWVTGIFIAAAIIVLALVDALMADAKRVRGVSKPVWVVLILVLPLVGAALWFAIGKPRKAQRRVVAPDDDPSFTGSTKNQGSPPIQDMDARLRDLEDQLKALDDEKYPGEEDFDGERK